MSDPTWSDGPGSPAERPPADAPARGRDRAPADDWQWDDIDWSEGTRPPSPEPTSVAREPQDERGVPRGGDQEPALSAHVALIRRRRIAALAVLGVLFILALAIPLVVFSGGGSSAEQTTQRTTASPTTTAAQQTTTQEQPAVTTTPSTTPETTPPQVTLPEGQTLSRGDSGSEVEDLQKGLAELGFSPGQPDGDFGANTEAAVIDFQQSNGLAPDGVVGTETVRLLNAALAQKSSGG
jgi:putative peptidoglycan binding protein